MLKGPLQHWGMTRSEEGQLIDDGELRRVELTERGQSGGGGPGFIADGSALMVGWRREANGDVGGVVRGQFDVVRERVSRKGARRTVARTPF
jgi:hypothetical protein